jgi:hypothetical protein
MKITLFNNMKGLIHGSDPKRIRCDARGVLRIGKTEVNIIPTADSIMPLLFYGCTGNYEATFTTSTGEMYNLETVEVRGGWIQPPPATTVELMELRCRADAAEEKIRELSGIFDTNSLNFIIK